MSHRAWIVACALVTGCFSPEEAVETEGGGDGPSSGGSTEPTAGPGGTDPSGGPSTSGTDTTAGTDPTDPTDPSDTDDPTDPSDTDDPSGADSSSTGGGAECGNGEVEGDEACDDGVNDGTYGGCNDDCTRAAFCGDGEQNGPEDCDDGDEVDGNGCNVNCVPSGLQLWTHEVHVTPNDACVAVVTTEDDHVYLAARIDNLDGGEFAGSFYAERLSATGSVDWEREHAPLATATTHDYLTYDATDGGDGVVLTGAHRLNATDHPVISGSYSEVHTVKLAAANGDVDWSRNDAGPGFPAGVVTDESGDVVVAAYTSNDFDSYVYRFSSAGDLQGQPDITLGGRATALAFDPAGSFLLGASPDGATIQRMNAGFGVLWTAVLSLSDVRGLTVAADEDIFAVGGGWVGRRASGNGAEVWTVATNEVAALGDPHAVGATAEGDIVVAGGRQGAPWVARLDPSGAVLWSRSAAEAGAFASVGLRADGSVIACGTVDGGGQGDNIFVATYTP